MDDIKKNKIKVVYKESNDYKIVPISGLFGGLIDEGMVHCEFLVDKNATPNEAELVFDSQKKIFRENHANYENYVIREKVFGALMTTKAARSIGNWLIKQADEYERIKENENEEKNDE